MPVRTVTVNGRSYQVDADDDTPLLWVLRDLIGLTGTKYGCGEGICGACTILNGDEPVRSCLRSLIDAAGQSFTTIEGLSPDGADPVQQAWLSEDVSQCGYCQPGMIMEIKALLRRKERPSAEEIETVLSDHVCRCGSYPRIRDAAMLAASSGERR